jgi:hypothetical protein
MSPKRLLTVFAIVAAAAVAALAWQWPRANDAAAPIPAIATPESAPVDTGLALETLTVRERRESPERQVGEDISATLSYPKTGQAALDELIELWIGTQCPTANPEGKPATPQACLKQLLAECRHPEGADPAQPLRCSYRAQVTPEMNAHGLLTLRYSGEQYSGGIQGSPEVAFLNIDVETGDPLRLQNLIRMRPEKLQKLLDHGLREVRGIAAEQSLTAAGLPLDVLPVPETVAVRADGLLFVWQADEVAAPAEGPYSVLLSYAQLKKAIPTNSPLRRLPSTH